MGYRDLRDFIAQLESSGELQRVSVPVSPHLEMTALCDRVLRAGGPALLFEQPVGHAMPVLANLFGTPRRVARAMGVAGPAALRELGAALAALKDPEAPGSLRDVGSGDLAVVFEFRLGSQPAFAKTGIHPVEYKIYSVVLYRLRFLEYLAH